jgi:hypothetical protein
MERCVAVGPIVTFPCAFDFPTGTFIRPGQASRPCQVLCPVVRESRPDWITGDSDDSPVRITPVRRRDRTGDCGNDTRFLGARWVRCGS